MEQDKRLISFELITIQAIEEIIDSKIKLLRPEPEKPSIPDEILDTKGVMNLCKASKSCIENWRKQGLLPFSKMGKGKNAAVRFKLSDIYKALEENRIFTKA